MTSQKCNFGGKKKGTSAQGKKFWLFCPGRDGGELLSDIPLWCNITVEHLLGGFCCKKATPRSEGDAGIAAGSWVCAGMCSLADHLLLLEHLISIIFFSHLLYLMLSVWSLTILRFFFPAVVLIKLIMQFGSWHSLQQLCCIKSILHKTMNFLKLLEV